MAARVFEATDPIPVGQLCVLLYGQPGSRKTSLAQTAEDPITLAFDAGVYRAYGRKKSVQFDDWPDVVGFETAPHKTVVVDTIGMAIDKLAATIIRDNPKNSNRMGGLSLPGFGVLKDQFKQWVQRIREKGQSLVFIAHEKEDKNGDEPYYRPDITGGSYATLMNVCDAVGYLHFADGKKCIDFAPTDRWMAKVPPWSRDPHIVLPDFATSPHFLGELIAEAKASMGRVSANNVEVVRIVEDWRTKLADIATVEDSGSRLDLFNAEIPRVAELKNGLKTQVWHMILEHAKFQNWTLPKGSKAFVAAGQEGAAA